MERRRRSRKHPRFPALAVAGVLILACAAGASSIRPEDSPDFVPLEKLNPELMPVGTPVVTYGAYAGRIDNAVVLKGSSVIFAVDPEDASDVDFRALVERGALRIDGVTAFRERTSTYYVRIEHIEPAPNLRERVLDILKDSLAPPAKLIETGKWARSAGKQFQDERLQELADALFMRALKDEVKGLEPTDYEGRFAVARKATELLGKPWARENYVRDGVEAYLLAHGVRSPQAYYDAARTADELLPGSTLSEQLLQEGFALDAGGRTPKAAADYYALAAKAKDIFGPGIHYDNLLGRGLDAEYDLIREDDYAALYSLARRAREIYPDYPRYLTLVTRAMAAEKSIMNARDSQAWIRHGNRVLYFLDDKYQAGIIFRTAANLDPSNVEARGKLRELGYVFYQGNWWRTDEFGKSNIFRRALELEDLAAEGKLAVGMSRDQVLSAKGMPDEVAASAGGWGLATQWTYRDGAAAVYVTFIADTVVSKGEIQSR